MAREQITYERTYTGWTDRGAVGHFDTLDELIAWAKAILETELTSVHLSIHDRRAE